MIAFFMQIVFKIKEIIPLKFLFTNNKYNLYSHKIKF